MPSGFDHWTTDERSRWVQHNASFVLLADHSDLDGNKVVMFQKKEEGVSGVCLLFDDTHREWMTTQQAEEIITRQTGKTMAEWTKLQESSTQTGEDGG